MANDKNFWTTKSGNKWAVKKEGSDRASSLHDTQKEAWEATKERARKSKGEAYLQGKNGQIRERNTYGNDPRKTKG